MFTDELRGLAADRADQLSGYRAVARPMLDTVHFTLVRGPAAGSYDDLSGGLPGPVAEPKRMQQ